MLVVALQTEALGEGSTGGVYVDADYRCYVELVEPVVGSLVEVFVAELGLAG